MVKSKKIVSFCSLFSLVLILSVYYVLSPIDGVNDMNVNSNIEEDSVVSVIDGESAYFQNLNILKEIALEEEIKQLETIIASADYTSEEKVSALEVKNTKIKMNENEKKLAKVIKDNGYDNVYVEYEGNKINILVSKSNAGKAEALSIMRAIYPSVDGEYIPNIMFKS